jgi:hypothetical protein
MFFGLACILSLAQTPAIPETQASDPSDREAAIARIEKIGGRISFDNQKPGKPVTRIAVRGDDFDDDVMKSLRLFPELKSLRLHEAAITDAGMSHLKHCKQLQHLDIGHSDITDKGIEAIAHLTELEDLDIGHTKVSGAGLAKLTELTKLKTIRLSGTMVSDADLAHLKNWPKLERLSLGLRGNITDDASIP